MNTALKEEGISIHEFSELAVKSLVKHGGMFLNTFTVSYTIDARGEVKHAAGIAPGKIVNASLEIGDWVMKCGNEYIVLRKGIL